jgi:type IX secretion system PorP/SprF family membrane protein
MLKFTFKKLIIFLGLLLSLTELKAQDIQFSMFYAVPLYINPAFAGSRHANRAMVHHRWQWPNQAGRFYTAMFSFDTYSMKYKSGIGAMVIHDYGNSITSTHLMLQYAYELRLNSVHTLRFGIQGGFIQRQISADDTPSQYTNEGRVNPSAVSFSRNLLYPDISAGVLWYAKRLYASVSAHHMNRPNESAFSSNRYAALPIKFTLTAGYKIPIVIGGGENGNIGSTPVTMAITPTITYKKQLGSDTTFWRGGGSGDQVDLGIYYTYKWLIAGLWYRGIPFKALQDSQTGKTYPNNESIVFLFGASYMGLGFGYAYDLTVSSQGPATGGSHEINLSYVFRTKHTKKPLKSLPCPDFEYDILRRGTAGRAK